MRHAILAAFCLIAIGLSACADWRTEGFYGDEFYKMDANGDRSLSPDEMAPYYGEKIFREMDVNGSGDVTPMEFYRYPNSVRNN